MNDLEDLKKRVDHLQYDEINPMKDELSEIRVTLSNNDLLTKQVMCSNKKLNETMDTFKDTLIAVAQSVKDSNRVSSQIADTVDKLNNKVTNMEKDTRQSIAEFNNKLDALDEKSKIDILLFIKNNWFGIFGFCGVIYTIIEKIM